LPCPVFYIGTVDFGARCQENPGDVPEVLLGPALPVVFHLFDDHILGSGEVGLEVLGRVYAAEAPEPAAVEGGVAADDDVDLEAGSRVDDVELSRLPDGVADCFIVEIVILSSSDGPM
jgi:hypothetical protein